MVHANPVRPRTRRTFVRGFVALITCLCVLIAAAPAAALTFKQSQPDLHAAKSKNKKKRKKAKKKPKYRININFEGTNRSVEECVEGDVRVVTTGHFTTKWGQTGTYPGGGSRRSGYTESWLERESNDEYLPPFKTSPVRKPVEAAFGKDKWPVQINVKRTKFSYDWDNAAGDTVDSVMKAPTKVGRQPGSALSRTTTSRATRRASPPWPTASTRSSTPSSTRSRSPGSSKGAQPRSLRWGRVG